MRQEVRNCEDCSLWPGVKKKLKITTLLRSLIGGVETRAAAKELRPTVAEYLKLLQIELELAGESPKEIRVTWVEPETMSSGEEST